MEHYSNLKRVIDCCKVFPLDIFEGIVITDRKGIILYSDERHSALFGRTPEEEVGRSIIELNNCSLFPKVINTGRPVIGKNLSVKGREFIGSILPLRKEDKVIGGIGINLFNGEGYNGEPHVPAGVEFCNLPTGKSTSDKESAFDNVIGESEVFKNVKEMALDASKLDLPVLITGETGTGKMMFAKAIHNASIRSGYPFFPINCSAIPKDLFETEFFGYAPGAFSGCNPKGKPGKFELAHKGTIFLDEIGNLPLEFQAKLLDVLQEKEVVRIGGIRPLDLDFRLVTATSECLEEMVQQRLFRSDLYFRINVLRIHLPALRERKEDIPSLIRFKLREIVERYHGKGEIDIQEGIVKHLADYPFPGNVRELFNILERMMVTVKGRDIKKEDLCFPIVGHVQPAGKPAPLKILIEKAEREAITQALNYARSDVTDAAKILEIHRTTLYKKIEKYRMCADL